MAAVLKPIPLTQTLMLDSPLMEQTGHVGSALVALSFSLLCACVAPGYASIRQHGSRAWHGTVPYKNMITDENVNTILELHHEGAF